MLRQRKLRDRLVAMAAPPILISAAGAIALLVAGGDGPPIGLIALAATALVAGWSLLIGWTMIRSLNSLAIASSGLAEAQARIASGELEATELPGIDHRGPDDEIARVARSVNAISRSAIELADAQRESIRKGLATIVINLARRNQSLLDRQVEYLDTLEQSEEDPDRLAELFRVDHLATRMRRNAESLLVLAGADTVKRKGAPVAMSDVLRVAIGEVENYRHIELGVVEDGQVPAGVAVDLAHLTAELMENATQFSPPSTTVEVNAIVDRPSGCVTISVTDRGMGLGDRLELANETLANPPELGLGMGRSLGFMVVGRLASRLGAAVDLRANEGGGTIANVNVPLSLFQLEEPADPKPQAAATPPQAKPEPAPPEPAVTSQPDPVEAPRSAPSTTLEKLLGIGPKTATPAAAPPEPVSDEAPAQPAPAPVEAPAEPAWQQASPFEDSTVIGNSAPLPPPADDPTWASMSVDAGPQAEAPPWTPPTPTPPTSTSASASASAGLSDSAPVDEPKPLAGPPPLPDQPIAASSLAPLAPPPVPSAPAADSSPPPQPPPPPLVPPTDGSMSPPAPAPQAEPSFDSSTWAPPAVTPPPPSRFDEAVPSGQAFESGVASLLDPQSTEPTGWPDTNPAAEPSPGKLQRRQPGASNVPVGQGRPVAAPSRSPEEVRAMLSRYREGLKGGGKNGQGSGSAQDHVDDKDAER